MNKVKEHNQNANRQRYRQRHPEKELQWRLNQYAKKLRANGWKVEPPANKA